MKKMTAFLTIAPIILVLSVLSTDSFMIYKSFAYAEDNLNSFQQDIISAKQKQQSIRSEMDNVGMTLDRQKALMLQQEAQNLIDEMMRDGYAHGPDGLKFISDGEKNSSPQEVKVQTKPEKKEPPKKRWFFMPYKEKQVTESELAYKVAISDSKITVEEAVEIGLENNVAVKAALRKVDVGQAKLSEAKRALFPVVQGVVNYDQGGKQPGESGSGISFRKFVGESYKVNITQPLYHGGELTMNIKQAEENLKVAKAEAKKVRNEFIHQIRSAYYAAVKSEYNVQYEIELYDRANAIYKRVLDARREKLITEIEYLNVESQYQQIFVQVELSNNDLLTANMTLRQALRMDSEVPLPLDLRLNFEKITPGFEEVLDMAYKNNPDYLSKEFALRSAHFALEGYKAKQRLHLDLRGSYGVAGEQIRDDLFWTPGGSGADPAVNPITGNPKPGEEYDFNKNKEWFLGVKGTVPFGVNSVEWERFKRKYPTSVISPTDGSEEWYQRLTFNLFDRLSDITDEASAHATLLQVESELEKTKNTLSSKVREDFYNIQKSLIQIDSSIAKIRYQEKQNSIQAYLVGLQESQPASLLEGYMELAQHKFAFIQSVIDYDLAVSSLGVSTGDPYYFTPKL